MQKNNSKPSKKRDQLSKDMSNDLKSDSNDSIDSKSNDSIESNMSSGSTLASIDSNTQPTTYTNHAPELIARYPWADTWLTTYIETASVAEACEKSGCSRRAFHLAMKNELFAQAQREALEILKHKLRDTIWRLAESDPRVAIRLAETHLPEFRDSVAPTMAIVIDLRKSDNDPMPNITLDPIDVSFNDDDE